MEAKLVIRATGKQTSNESDGGPESLLFSASVLETLGLGRRGRVLEGWWKEQELGDD